MMSNHVRSINARATCPCSQYLRSCAAALARCKRRRARADSEPIDFSLSAHFARSDALQPRAAAPCLHPPSTRSRALAAMRSTRSLRRRDEVDAPADTPLPTSYELQSLPKAAPASSSTRPAVELDLHTFPASATSAAGVPVTADVDVEHLPVQGGDPRDWSQRKKLLVFGAVAFASVLNTLASSLYLPAIDAVQADLGASDEAISLSVSMFIFVRASIP